MAVVPASSAVIAAVVTAAVLPGVLRLAMVLPAACAAAAVVAAFAAAVLVAAAILPVENWVYKFGHRKIWNKKEYRRTLSETLKIRIGISMEHYWSYCVFLATENSLMDDLG